jgi:hypothetical protein
MRSCMRFMALGSCTIVSMVSNLGLHVAQEGRRSENHARRESESESERVSALRGVPQEDVGEDVGQEDRAHVVNVNMHAQPASQ